MQKFVSDLSISRSIFDGFADYDLLTRRAASLKWAINPNNVPLIDQYTFENRDIPIMLDDNEGWNNVKRIVDMYKPDVVFVEALSVRRIYGCRTVQNRG